MTKLDLIKVNKKLKEDILSKLPKEYSNLEKAIFIYYELCKKLRYSLEFYVNKNLVQDDFLNINNLEQVDGMQTTDVVCYTFNAIFTKLLSEANICDIEPTNQIFIDDSGEFSPYHNDLYLKIDGEEFSVDPTLGVLDNNDLTLAKYSNYTLQGWEPAPGQDPKTDARLTKKIERAVKKVQGDNKVLMASVQEYLRAKALDNSYEQFSLDDRVKIFLSGLNFCPKYSILSFNYLLKLKRKLFTASEQGKNMQEKINIDLMFTPNKDFEYEAYLFYNSKGYIPDVGCENFDALKIWRISIKNKSVESLTIDELNQLLNDHTIISRGEMDDVFEFGMSLPGYPHLTAIYNHNSAKHEVFAYKRTYLTDGHTETLTPDQAEALIIKCQEPTNLTNKKS